MAYLLNSVNLTTYGITAGQAPGGNVALQGCFDLPERIGDTHHIWDDDSTVEPYVAADEMYFAGRDIKFYGTIIGNSFAIYTYLDAFYAAINAFTTLVTFSTPYGDFSVQVKDIKTKKYNGALSLEITFREPVVTLTGGSLPATGANAYTIDSIPMSSFGLYVTKPEEIHDLPEIKSQYFTKYGAEGYQIVKRKANNLEIDGFLMATSLVDFQAKIKALYLLFSQALTRTVVLNYEKTVTCFAIAGFKIDSVQVLSNLVIAKFRINLLCTSIVKYAYSDWVLPSVYACAFMYYNLKAEEVGGISDAVYWSSSERSTTEAWGVDMSIGSYYYGVKEGEKRVRAIRSFTADAGRYSLRDIGPAGGLIFYIEGTTYFEAATSDQSTGKAWSNITDAAIGTTLVTASESQNNTNEIIAQEGHTDSAAKLCNDLVL